MKKIWNFILKYRIYIALLFFIVFCIFIYITVKAYVDPVDETTVYGSRLTGIEKVPITDAFKEEVIKFIKEDKNITDVSINVKGKIINTIINAKKEATVDSIKKLANSVMEKYKKEEKEFYDFQFFVKNVDANYALIGYKNKKNTDISWSEDEIVKSEVEVNEEKQ